MEYEQTGKKIYVSSNVEKEYKDVEEDNNEISIRKEIMENIYIAVHNKIYKKELIEKTFENETALLPVESYWCREVVLYGDGKPWVAARTLISKDLLTHYQSLFTLGDKPIGEWLFSLSAQRVVIQWAKDPESGLYARRSLFLVQEMPLLISELFLENSLISE